MARILTVTLNPAVDKSCSVEQVFADHKLHCRETTYHPGGGGINVARAITKLGGSVTAYWPCGGAIGELLQQLLDNEEVEHHPLPIQAMTRENLTVLEKANSRQFRFGMPGAALTDHELENLVEAVRTSDPPPDYLVLSGSLPPKVDTGLYARLANAMPDTCRVILDTRGKPLRLGLESQPFLVKPNIRELEQLADHPIEDDRQLRDVAASLIDQDKTQVVVTSLGSGGAVLTTADGHETIRSPTVRIRSKVGAGDSMVAGIVFALSQEKTLSEAVRFGAAAGAAAVMSPGTELCSLKDTQQLYSEMSDSQR